MKSEKKIWIFLLIKIVSLVLHNTIMLSGAYAKKELASQVHCNNEMSCTGAAWTGLRLCQGLLFLCWSWKMRKGWGMSKSVLTEVLKTQSINFWTELSRAMNSPWRAAVSQVVVVGEHMVFLTTKHKSQNFSTPPESPSFTITAVFFFRFDTVYSVLLLGWEVWLCAVEKPITQPFQAKRVILFCTSTFLPTLSWTIPFFILLSEHTLEGFGQS